MKQYIFLMATVMGLSVYAQDGDLLTRSRAVYENKRVETEALFREKRLAMPSVQVMALRQLEAQYQKAGDLKSMLAVQEERRRFVMDPRGSAIPVLSSPPELARLLVAYKEHYREVAEERDRSWLDLDEQYRDALKKMQITLTQQGKIEDAKTVMLALSALENFPRPSAGRASERRMESAPRVQKAGGAENAKPVGSDDDFFKDW